MPLNCAFKNGYNCKLYVMHVLPKWKTAQHLIISHHSEGWLDSAGHVFCFMWCLYTGAVVMLGLWLIWNIKHQVHWKVNLKMSLDETLGQLGLSFFCVVLGALLHGYSMWHFYMDIQTSYIGRQNCLKELSCLFKVQA